MPDAEVFSFVFNTLLSDVAARCPEHRDCVIEAQVGLVTETFSCSKVDKHIRSLLLNTVYKATLTGQISLTS